MDNLSDILAARGVEFERTGRMPPILFLDVDGVLNAHVESFDEGGLHVDKVRLLARIIGVTDCRVILSSAWRYMGAGPNSVFGQCVRGVLADNDDEGYDLGLILGALAGQTGPEPNGPEDRDVTIRRWLDENGEPGRWVALDDLECVRRLGDRHAVVTDGKIGMTPKDAHQVIERL